MFMYSSYALFRTFRAFCSNDVFVLITLMHYLLLFSLYTAAHTAEVQRDTKTSLPDTKASLPLAAIAGGSAAGAAVIASVTVTMICCLIMKSKTGSIMS